MPCPTMCVVLGRLYMRMIRNSNTLHFHNVLVLFLRALPQQQFQGQHHFLACLSLFLTLFRAKPFGLLLFSFESIEQGNNCAWNLFH